jgi:uncharacterized membrane protein (Fun14 family)
MKYLAEVDIGNSFGSPFGRTAGVGSLVSTIVSAALVLAGIIVLVLFIAGGIGVIASAGSNNPEGAAKGKQALTSALIGFIIVFAAYWIIQIIENITGVNILNLNL